MNDRLILLPGDSPDLNPEGSLIHDVKANAVGRQRPADQAELIANVRMYLRITPRSPAVARRFFDDPSVRYAAVRCHRSSAPRSNVLQRGEPPEVVVGGAEDCGPFDRQRRQAGVGRDMFRRL